MRVNRRKLGELLLLGTSLAISIKKAKEGRKTSAKIVLLDLFSTVLSSTFLISYVQRQPALRMRTLRNISKELSRIDKGEASKKSRVLLVSSNGAGLGHLTRLNAISQHIDAETHIFTMSQGYKALGKGPEEITYFPSYRTLGLNSKQWNHALERTFSTFISIYRPDCVVFDGSSIYKAVSDSCRVLGVPLYWIQRGCWKSEVDSRSQQRHHAKLVCDGVIIPGDYGCEETVDVGPGVHLAHVPPIVSFTDKSLLSKKEALNELGLREGKKYALIQLGAGVINSTKNLRTEALRAVQSLGNDWVAVITKNPLVHTETSSQVIEITRFPISTHLNAFDLVISAAGYNSVQESVAVGIPSVFIPNLNTTTDDQERRAKSLSEQGCALVSLSSQELAMQIKRAADPKISVDLRDKCRSLPSANGAIKTAKVLEEWMRKDTSKLSQV